MTKEELLKQLEDDIQSKGKTLRIRYLKGERLTRDQSIKSHCAECMGFYDGGRIDCEVGTCSLYPFMPYRTMRQKATREAIQPLQSDLKNENAE